MATTSIWRINGQMGHVINYVENVNKTTSPMEVPVGLSNDTLEDVIAYAGREDATNKRKLITGINLDCNDAKNQMMIVKKNLKRQEELLHIMVTSLLQREKSTRIWHTK